MDEEETYVSAKNLSDWCVELDTIVFERLFCVAGLQVPIDKDDRFTDYDLTAAGKAIGGEKSENPSRIYYPADKLNFALEDCLKKLMDNRDKQARINKQLDEPRKDLE